MAGYPQQSVHTGLMSRGGRHACTGRLRQYWIRGGGNIYFWKFQLFIIRCSAKRSCSLVVSSAVFGDPCPGTEKYLEVHYSCVSRQSITTPRVLVPPWFLDIAVTPPASYARGEEDMDTVAVSASTVGSNITHLPSHHWLKLGESESYSVSVDESTNIVICVTISAISCVILVTIYIIIQRHHSSTGTPIAKCSCSHNTYHSVYPPLPSSTETKLRAEDVKRENINLLEFQGPTGP